MPIAASPTNKSIIGFSRTMRIDPTTTIAQPIQVAIAISRCFILGSTLRSTAFRGRWLDYSQLTDATTSEDGVVRHRQRGESCATSRNPDSATPTATATCCTISDHVAISGSSTGHRSMASEHTHCASQWHHCATGRPLLNRAESHRMEAADGIASAFAILAWIGRCRRVSVSARQ